MTTPNDPFQTIDTVADLLTGASPPSESTRPAAPSAKARRSQGRYDRVSELGRGGWGVVDRVVDRQLEREVAIKRIGGDGRTNGGKLHPEIRNRFLHEAKITSQLQHPGVVPVHELATGENGEVFYVMKLLDGDTFRQLIRAQHAPAKQPQHHWTQHTLQSAIAPLLDRFIDICNAVGYAHQQGVIHRDLKPANVMVGGFGETIVVDWGLAKRFDLSALNSPVPTRVVKRIEADTDAAFKEIESLVGNSGESAQHTIQGTIVGTPAYMSPEQAAGHIDQLGPRSDIYSLGVILYEIASGQHPYHGMDIEAVMKRSKAGQWPPLKSVQPSVPNALAAICECAMAFDPGARYATAGCLAEDVRRLLAGEPVSVYSEPWLDRVFRFCHRHHTSCIVTAVSTAVLLFGAIAFGVVIHGAHQDERSARVEAESEHQSAVRALVEARDTTDACLVDLGASLESVPGTEAIRQQMQTAAIEHYQRLLEIENKGSIESLDTTVRLERAKCNLRLGDLYRATGDVAVAAHHYDESEHILTACETRLAFVDAFRLQLIKVITGKVLLGISDYDSVRGDAVWSVDQNRAWLLQRLPSDPAANTFLPGDNQDEQIKIATALVRYLLAKQQNLEEAEQWSQWLVAVRGEPRDYSLLKATYVQKLD